jgi:hypothetical protein
MSIDFCWRFKTAHFDRASSVYQTLNSGLKYQAVIGCKFPRRSLSVSAMAKNLGVAFLCASPILQRTTSSRSSV